MQIREKRDDHERIMTVRMPFDRRHSDPNKNYGVGSLFFCMAYLKNNCAVNFSFSVPFYLPHVARGFADSESLYAGMGYDVGQHSPTPQFDGQEEQDCNILPGGKCYCGGSALRADEWYKNFLRQKDGFEWVWEELAREWEDRVE